METIVFVLYGVFWLVCLASASGGIWLIWNAYQIKVLDREIAAIDKEFAANERRLAKQKRGFTPANNHGATLQRELDK